MWMVAAGIGGGDIGHAFGVDATDERSLTAALIHGRTLVTEYERYYKEYLVGFEKMRLVATGALLGIRESRRILGDYLLCLDDFTRRANFADEIGRYCYPVDIHVARPDDDEEYERFLQEYDELRYADSESYGIPYRCLIPRELRNVLVAGRCVSTDRFLQASIRVMPGCYITGPGAGSPRRWRRRKTAMCAPSPCPSCNSACAAPAPASRERGHPDRACNDTSYSYSYSYLTIAIQALSRSRSRSKSRSKSKSKSKSKRKSYSSSASAGGQAIRASFTSSSCVLLSAMTSVPSVKVVRCTPSASRAQEVSSVGADGIAHVAPAQFGVFAGVQPMQRKLPDRVPAHEDASGVPNDHPDNARGQADKTECRDDSSVAPLCPAHHFTNKAVASSSQNQAFPALTRATSLAVRIPSCARSSACSAAIST